MAEIPIEQKKLLNDPNLIESNVSRAIDLVFDNRDLSVAISNSKLTPKDQDMEAKPTNQADDAENKTTGKHKLKINSNHLISLDEMNEFDSTYVVLERTP